MANISEQSHKHGHDHAHDHGHEHQHGPGHAHVHASPGTLRFYITILLNAGFATLELVYGLVSESMALVADAGHNFSDVLSLVLALFAVYLGRVSPNSRFTYGLGRSSILIAIINGVILFVAAGAIALESVRQLQAEQVPPGMLIVSIAGIGFVINAVSTLLFLKGSKHDVNIRGALLHLAADAAVSLGVCLGGLAIYFTGWYWIDPAISLVIVAVIVISTVQLLIDSIKLSLDAVPAHIDIEAIRVHLMSLPEVEQIHDLHVWPLSTTDIALTVHLVCPPALENAKATSLRASDDLLLDLQAHLKSQYNICHATIQIESRQLDQGCHQ